MGKMFFFVCFLILAIEIHSQTWTVQNEETTIISKEQFDRIVRAQETIAMAVSFNFFDAAETGKGRVISGTRPILNGYYYMTIKLIPDEPYIRSIVAYGNSKTGRMVIIFYSSLLPGTISLQYNRNEYVRQYNQLINLVNGE
jgi:hypothetical protein